MKCGRCNQDGHRRNGCPLGEKERLVARTVVNPVTGCWEWQSTRGPLGYGVAWDIRAGKVQRAHRISYRLHVGPIPPGLVLDHLCRNPPCINPAHLEAVTQQVNIDRGRLGSIIRSRRAQAYCKRGHELAGDNLKLKKNGTRECRACARALLNERRRLFGRTDWPRLRP